MKKINEAYMTVEASFIMPFVLALLVLLIYASFFLYDRCCCYQDSYMICLQESIRKDQENTINPAIAERKARDWFGEKYAAADALTYAAKAEGRIIRFYGSGSVNPLPAVNVFSLPGSTWKFDFSSEARKSDPALNIRKFMRIREAAESGLRSSAKEEEADND